VLELGILCALYMFDIKAQVGGGVHLQLGDLVLAAGNFKLATECLTRAKDHSALLLLYSCQVRTCLLLASICPSIFEVSVARCIGISVFSDSCDRCQGDRSGMESLAKDASEAGRTNVAFVCNYLLGHTSECLNLLVETGRTPEAAFFARTYAPSQVSRMVELWKEDLTKVNEKAAESLADPAEYPNLFQDFDLGLIAEHQACVCVCVCVCVCILPLLAQQYLLTGAKVQMLTQLGVAGV